MKLPFKYILGLTCCVCALLSIVYAQDKAPTPTAPVSACSRDSALAIIQPQIDLSKTIDDDVKRIGVMLRAADLAWPGVTTRPV